MIDINVLVDVLQRREPFFYPSATVCDMAANGKLEGLIPAHAVTTIFHIMHRCADSAAANKALGWLLGAFDIATVDKAALQRARGLKLHDFENAIVVAAAESARCSCIVTRTIRGFSASPIPAIVPAEFISSYQINKNKEEKT